MKNILGFLIFILPIQTFAIEALEERTDAIFKACSMGRTITVEGDVKAAMSKWLKGISLEGKAQASDVGAIVNLIPKNEVGVDMYRVYTGCLKDMANQEAEKILLEKKQKCESVFKCIANSLEWSIECRRSANRLYEKGKLSKNQCNKTTKKCYASNSKSIKNCFDEGANPDKAKATCQALFDMKVSDFHKEGFLEELRQESKNSPSLCGS